MSDVTGAAAHLLAHGPAVPAMLLASGAALVATAGFHTWWSRRHGHAPPADDTGARAEAGAEAGTEAEDSALWRMRTTVRDAPGSLAVLCAALADRRVDILSLQTHPLAEGTVDEFLLRAPGELTGSELAGVVAAAGGVHTWTERADAHDLVDAPTRVLGLATRTALDAAELLWRSGSCWAAAPSGRCPPPPGDVRRTTCRRRVRWRTRCCGCALRRAG